MVQCKLATDGEENARRNVDGRSEENGTRICGSRQCLEVLLGVLVAAKAVFDLIDGERVYVFVAFLFRKMFRIDCGVRSVLGGAYGFCLRASVFFQ